MSALRLTLVLALTIGGTAARAVAAAPEESVVRVFATLRLPNPSRPWAKQNPVEMMGTGVVIDGKRILTNAHVVLYASEVRVQGRDGGDRVDAKLAGIGPGIDLATLTVDDPEFLEKRPAMPRASKRPTTNTPVALLGFPVGGSGLATTRGVISRVDFAQYNALTVGLRLQVDAAINPGSSGGPALVDGRMVGLTYGQLGRAENVGYVIPNEEIDAFLDDLKDGRYDGKLRVDDMFQALENEALRGSLGLARSVRGVMIRHPAVADPKYPLREGDVLTKFGTMAVDNEGMVDYEPGLRLPFEALIPRVAKEDKIPVGLIRDGKPLEVELLLTRKDTRLVKSYQGQYPPYFVHGPLVFSPVLDEVAGYYMRGNPGAIMGSPLLSRSADHVDFPGEELVAVTAPFLSHRITRGYDEPFGNIVADVDGVKIKNLRHLVETLRDGQGEYLRIRFHGKMSETLVFRRAAVEEATSDLMSENGIPKRGSEDVLTVWHSKPALAR